MKPFTAKKRELLSMVLNISQLTVYSNNALLLDLFNEDIVDS